MTAVPVNMRSIHFPGKQPATAPMVKPVENATGTANNASVAVLYKAPETSRITGRRVAIDSPKSPTRTRPSHFRNWIGNG